MAAKTDLRQTEKQAAAAPLVILNPQSASGATGRAWPGLASDLATHFGPFEVAFTEYGGHARLLAESAAQDGRLIIACGGDGTINEVANGIITSGAAAVLGVLPSGTGGDFRRTLGISNHAPTAARALREGVARRMDAGRVTFTNERGRQELRYFLGVASFGLSAGVIRRVKEEDSSWLAAGARLLGGPAAFAVAALRTSLSDERPRVSVELDGQDEGQLTVANLCVCNARYFGGGMMIAPDAKLDDGLFDVVAVGDLNTSEIVANSLKLYRGAHLDMEQVGHARAARVTARAVNPNERIALEIDGELPGAYLPATFSIVPDALLVNVAQTRSW
jgi:YegS/Rv2252/BmrU family lipid kinase